jgi:HK97 family phage portal protein
MARCSISSIATISRASTEDLPAVPAGEIIHDRINTLFHPLVGLSPIFACGLAALQADEIQANATTFFRNGSNPGGVLTAPGAIDDVTANRMKTEWDEKFTGQNAGKVAVLGNGLTYEAMGVNAVDAELIAQLKWTAETICACFGVPAYMVGVGAAPLNNNVEALEAQYYSQCLQIHIVTTQRSLSDGLGLQGAGYDVRFNLDDLLLMDTATKVKTLAEGVLGGLFMPDEGRKKLNLPPVKGGDTVYLQQQNYSLAALAKRDAKADPFAGAAPKPSEPAAKPEAAKPPASNDNQVAAALLNLTAKFMREAV